MSTESLETDKPLDEQTNRELRAKVAARTGHRPPKVQLNKEVLNSLHAWFTGEFYVKPAMLKPGVPPKSELLNEVVMKACNAYENHPIVDPEGVHGRDAGDTDAYEDHPAKALVDYFDEVAADDQPRPMNKAELRQLINAMDTADDQREWTA